MTRSENMRRLWADPEFRARAKERLSATATATNARAWTPERRAAQSIRTREANMARARLRNASRLDYKTGVSRETQEQAQ